MVFRLPQLSHLGRASCSTWSSAAPRPSRTAAGPPDRAAAGRSLAQRRAPAARVAWPVAGRGGGGGDGQREAACPHASSLSAAVRNALGCRPPYHRCRRPAMNVHNGWMDEHGKRRKQDDKTGQLTRSIWTTSAHLRTLSCQQTTAAACHYRSYLPTSLFGCCWDQSPPATAAHRSA